MWTPSRNAHGGMSRQTQAYIYAGSAVLLILSYTCLNASTRSRRPSRCRFATSKYRTCCSTRPSSRRWYSSSSRCGSVSWGRSTVASAFKVSLRYVEVPHLLLYATLVSTLVFLVVAVWQRKLGQVFSCSPKQYFRSAALGFLNPFLYYLVLFEAYDRLPAQEALPLNYTWPIVVVILSVPLLKQPIGRVSLAAIMVSFFGVLVISTRGDLLAFRLSDPVGTSLAVGSTFIWATFWLTNIRDDRDEVVKLLLNFAFGLLFVGSRRVHFSRPTSHGPARHWRIGIRGNIRDGHNVCALDARSVSLPNDRAGQQPRLSVSVPLARPHRRNRRGDDPSIVGNRTGLHRRRNRNSPIRSDRATVDLKWYHPHQDNAWRNEHGTGLLHYAAAPARL